MVRTTFEHLTALDVEVLSVNEKLVADDDDTTVFGGLRRSDGREEDNWRGGEVENRGQGTWLGIRMA